MVKNFCLLMTRFRIQTHITRLGCPSRFQIQYFNELCSALETLTETSNSNSFSLILLVVILCIALTFEPNFSMHFSQIPTKIPSDLKFKSHFEHVIAKMKSGLAALNMVKKTLPARTKLQIFNGLIKPHYEYASIAWSMVTRPASPKHNPIRLLAYKSRV